MPYTTTRDILRILRELGLDADRDTIAETVNRED